MARIVWTATSREDLRGIVQYIAGDSPVYARSFALRLRRSVARLAEFPGSGCRVPEDPSGTYREVIVGNYRVVYRTAEDSVVIVTVLHGAREIRRLFESGLG